MNKKLQYEQFCIFAFITLKYNKMPRNRELYNLYLQYFIYLGSLKMARQYNNHYIRYNIINSFIN